MSFSPSRPAHCQREQPECVRGQAACPRTLRSGLKPALAALLTLFMAGCAGSGRVSSPQIQSLNSRQAALTEEIERLNEEIRSLKSMQERYDHLTSDEILKQPLQEDIRRCSKKEQELEKRVDALEESITTARASWNKKLETVLDVVRKENAQLRSAIEQLQRSSASTGWEHTVSRGETLAIIAKEYGARARDIVEANDLDDPDKISVGQVLFIPRPSR